MTTETNEDTYIYSLEKLREKLTYNLTQKKEYEEDIKNIDNIISYITEQKTKMQILKKHEKFITQTENFKNKIEMLISFTKYVDDFELSESMCIYGSFIRNLIEKILVSNSDIIGYADPINHDIDMAVFTESYNYDFGKDKFAKFIENLKTLSIISELITNDDEKNFCFGKYKLVTIINKTLSDIKRVNDHAEPGFIRKMMINVPHYNLIFRNCESPDDIIKIDLLAYKELHNNMWGDEYNINSLKLTKSGIGNTKYNFFDTLYSIINKQAICNIDFENHLSKINGRYIIRSDKEPVLNQIMHFLTHRTKILDLGYTDICSNFKFLDINIEKDDDCNITGNSPPYIKIKLECSHELSLMALAGLINIRGSDYTEAINCPLCRQSLKFKLIDKPVKQIKFPQINGKSEFVDIPDYERDSNINSLDNINYISGVMYGLSLREINEVQEVTDTGQLHRVGNINTPTITRQRMAELYP